MRPTNYLPGPSMLLSAILLVAPAMGQKDEKDTNSKQDETPSSTPSAKDTGKTTTSPTPSKETKSTETTSATKQTKVSISNTGSLVTKDPTGNPTITGGPAQTTGGELTGFPTLTGPGVIPTYPPPSVPPTKNAPFMQQSNLPDGTVFIAVGAILGALGLALLLWRSIVSLMLHRSVARAAMAQHNGDSKAGFPAPPAPFYKYTDHASTMSVGGGGGATSAASAGRGVRRTNRGPIPSSTPSQSNLFFSPTAGAGASSNRGSSFLPSGFYAAGTSSPGGGNQTNSINLSNLRPDSRGHYANASRNTMDISPPDSPRVAARRDMSSSSLNVSLAPGQRAPSAYLDDLLTDDPNAFPPPQMPPSAGPRRSGSPANRF
ncbi:hypothetical protein VFPPC_13898 [Pochonia chlamydosporia 170]|uniref:Uncharacterized protein n=1 Tax=Pochonia chlamydosporia 170 TaxID=1380566 RepID=A0A179FGP7_METCM|nr:hypothetical protein VFPPC_13898 [Pochonia chlamydosporia 170]OAQ64460.1 hypothetical protein VFPPC_13898 [Pochonia chlamydosporia 170]